VTRPRLEDKDRIFWIGLLRLPGPWREALHIVQFETVIRWHRKGWRHYWRRKSKARKVGRPAIGWELVALIKRLSRENPLWGAPRIAAELSCSSSCTTPRDASCTWESPSTRPPSGQGSSSSKP